MKDPQIVSKRVDQIIDVVDLLDQEAVSATDWFYRMLKVRFLPFEIHSTRSSTLWFFRISWNVIRKISWRFEKPAVLLSTTSWIWFWQSMRTVPQRAPARPLILQSTRCFVPLAVFSHWISSSSAVRNSGWFTLDHFLLFSIRRWPQNLIKKSSDMSLRS